MNNVMDKLKMNANELSAVEICESILIKDRDYNIQNDIWSSLVIISNRVLSRSDEMATVYNELVSHYAEEQYKAFLIVMVETGKFLNSESVDSYRQDKRQLIALNQRIAALSFELSELLDKRDDLHGVSGFDSQVTRNIVDVIDTAASENGHYTSWIQDPLKKLDAGFDQRYWPDLANIIKTIGVEADDAKVIARDPVVEAAISSQRPSLADFFRAFFIEIDESRKQAGGELPDNFRLSDNAYSIIANCVLDLDPDDMIDASYVKGVRQRVRSSAK